MNKITQKQEAISRLNLLKIFPQAIKEFEQDLILNKSENDGLLFWLNETELKIVKNFENKYKALVYHVIHNYTEFGELYSLLYVSQHKEEWIYDKKDINRKNIFVYVYNVDNNSFSEFGNIGIELKNGGLVRLY